ncbi:MAG: alpha/beta hydrolase [Deinococcales bacterium]
MPLIKLQVPPNATHLIGDFTDDLDRPIAVHEGQEIALEVGFGAWVEYCFLDKSGTRFADPNNTLNAQNPWWREYRALALEGYTPDPWCDPLPDIPVGSSEALVWDSKILAGKRRAYLQFPPHFDPIKAYPVFLVQDGVAYRRTGKLGAVHDNLLHAGKIRPAIFCFLEPHDRTLEYYFNEAYLAFLLQDVIPRLESRFEVEQYGLWGASLGGLASLYAATQAPERFGMVVTQSGAFQGQPNTTYRRGATEWLTAQLEQQQKLPLRISADCGRIEWLLGTNRRLAALLFDKGYAHQYLERESGHNWTTWRNGLSAHLLWHLVL